MMSLLELDKALETLDVARVSLPPQMPNSYEKGWTKYSLCKLVNTEEMQDLDVTTHFNSP